MSQFLRDAVGEDDERCCDMWPIRILRPFELFLAIHRVRTEPLAKRKWSTCQILFFAHNHPTLKNFTTGFQSEVLMYREQYTLHVFLIPDFGLCRMTTVRSPLAG